MRYRNSPHPNQAQSSTHRNLRTLPHNGPQITALPVYQYVQRFKVRRYNEIIRKRAGERTVHQSPACVMAYLLHVEMIPDCVGDGTGTGTELVVLAAVVEDIVVVALEATPTQYP